MMMHNSDITSIINSEQVQSVLKAKKTAPKPIRVRKNPLRNKTHMMTLNPAFKMLRNQKRAMKLAAQRATKA